MVCLFLRVHIQEKQAVLTKEIMFYILCINSFWSASCKVPGGAHDATVFKQSQLFNMAHLLPKVHMALQSMCTSTQHTNHILHGMITIL